MTAKIWPSDTALPEYQKNLASMLNQNSSRFADKIVFQETSEDKTTSLTWSEFGKNISALQFSLKNLGFGENDHIAAISQNCRELLTLEMAVMSLGGVFIPIFPGYPAGQMDMLINFCEPKFVAVSDQTQYDKINKPGTFKKIIHFDSLISSDEKNLISINQMIESSPDSDKIVGEELSADTVSLMMYTSGTMGKPKCVRLTHGNILSQQAAMKVLWNLSSADRFLSYLPWHHSFGGIFEKYSAIVNGARLSLESGLGKDVDLLLSNWRKVKPTVFFSVPKVYQEIVTKVMQDETIEKEIFHKDLRFVFTAAAPLPQNISAVFEKRNIPIYEGWGLTETAPCCTVTDPDISRQPGVVGKPIPGISLALSDDNEILVKGPNVMKGYYNNREETERVLSEDGWFHTGDIGRFEESGLKLISRKDRILKLSNAEKVVPTEIENLIIKDCPYLAHAYVAGSGYDYPVILLFPNKQMFSQVSKLSDIKADCQCPNGFSEFAECLGQCVKKMNHSIEAKYSRVKCGMLIDYELSIENEELTPSMKLAPNVIGKVFKANIDLLYGKNENALDENKIYIINLEE